MANISPKNVQKNIKLLEIRPIPAATKRVKKVSSRRSLPSTILTELPYKRYLEEAENVKNKKIKIEKRKVMQDKSVNKENKDFCAMCKGSYSTSKEDWYQCKNCCLWAHETCGILNNLYFTCLPCVN